MFAGAYHFVYENYLSPEYDYASVLYFEPSALSLVLTYLLIAAPILTYRATTAVASYGSSLIFAIAYVPAQLFLLFNWQESAAALAVVQSSIAASMAVLFWASDLGVVEQKSFAYVITAERLELSSFLTTTLGVITAVGSLLLLFFFRQHMRLVALDDVYDLRFESAQYDYGPLVNYPLAWLGTLCLSFYYARGFLRWSPWDIGIAIVISLLLYAAMGVKSALLMGIAVYGLIVLFNAGEQFLLRLLVALAAITIILVLLPYQEDGPLRFIRAMFLLRVLGTGGWSMSLYYEFFSQNGYTYYTHIGPIGAMTGAYPYGALGLGQVIGLRYFGTEEANFNANFWASDAFAAMGVLGVPVATAALCVVWFGLNRAASEFSTRFAVVWLCAFWQGLLNAPISVALLSCGGLWVVALMYFNSAASRKSVWHSEEASR